jgi:hypothetical protein
VRALTLTQPWAGLVAAGIKLVENRPRHMIKREDVGKPFAIHASREIDATTYNRIAQLAPDVLLFGEAGRPVIPCKRDWYRLSRITSAVIAVATLDSIVDPLACGIDPDSDEARAVLAPDQRRWFFGPIGYVLRDVRALAAPVACRGYQAFWTLPADVAARVEEQLR